MMSQIEAASQWSYYQAKSIKSAVVDVKMSLTATPDEQDQSKSARYEKEQEEVKSEAEHKETAAKSYFHKHEVFARAVTMFQIAHLGCKPGVRRIRLRVSRARRDWSMKKDSATFHEVAVRDVVGSLSRLASATHKRSRKGICLDFNLRLASLSEKKQA